jgi:hypothetical protein
MKWKEWQTLINEAYELKKDLEARQAAGETLSEKDNITLEVSRSFASRYTRDGHKIPGAPPWRTNEILEEADDVQYTTTRERAMALIWEKIETEGYGGPSYSYRARVPGGWLVCFVDNIAEGGAGGLTFYPDPNHSWTP